jgi:hypothetical protein
MLLNTLFFISSRRLIINDHICKRKLLIYTLIIFPEVNFIWHSLSLNYIIMKINVLKKRKKIQHRLLSIMCPESNNHWLKYHWYYQAWRSLSWYQLVTNGGVQTSRRDNLDKPGTFVEHFKTLIKHVIHVDEHAVTTATGMII